MSVVGSHDGEIPGVAVLSDGSDFHRDPGSSIMTELLSWAVRIHEHAGFPTSALLVSATDTESLVAGIRRVATDFWGICLARINPARAAAAQVALADTAIVITDRQAQAVALVAALLKALATGGLAPSAGRVVIVGAEHNPMVATMAVAAGIGEIDSWGRDDACNFPLRTLSRGAAIIDLSGCVEQSEPVDGRAGSAPEHGSPARVITVDDQMTAFALAQLLTAARSSGGLPDIAECLACAQTLARIEHDGQTILARPDATTPLSRGFPDRYRYKVGQEAQVPLRAQGNDG